ncbi:MAG: type IV pilus modification PilV family protein [Planctomycetota bacterium]|jgi:prepilin-type N-terminal cleavage/methylation domain-containing protein
MRRTKKAFTLTEILIALGIFAIGGTAIMALFITNIRLSEQAMDYTRAAEIQRNVRSLLTQAVKRPNSVSANSTVYEFYYPGTSLSFVPREYLEGENEGETVVRNKIEEIGGSPNQNTIYFKLPDKMFDANVVNYDRLPTSDQKLMMTSLPNEACNINGSQVSWPNVAAGPQVFRFKPSVVRNAGVTDGFDKDDRMFYSFDFSIRRSNARASVSSGNKASAKAPLTSLYVVHLRVYKGFSLPEDNSGDVVQNTPIYETDFYISAAR